PENPLVFGAGPLVGSSAPGSAKIAATTKFALPATADGRHYVASAVSGSRRFGPLLRRAGFDHIVVTGRSTTPVYLRLFDEEVELCEAADLWGKKDIYDTTDLLSERHGPCGVVAIGRAGEQGCRFAMAVTDKQNTLGRSGLGAVMGSKNLKAVVCTGTRPVPVADPARVREAARRVRERYDATIKPGGDFFGQAWSSLILENLNPGVWSKHVWDELYGPKAWPGLRKPAACNSCWIACLDSVRVPDGEHAGAHSRTGTYLWVAVVGQKLGLTDPRQAVRLLEVMNREGICAATSSSLIDWATRRYEQGVITSRDTGGLALERNLGTYLALLDAMVQGRGLGATLSQGWFEASRWLGRDARTDYEEGCGIAKGTDCIYPARAAKLDPMRFSMGLTNPRGGQSCLGASVAARPLLPLDVLRQDAARLATPADALERIFTPSERYGAFNPARLTRHLEDFNSAMNCLGACELWQGFQLLGGSELAELYSAVSGTETGAEELKLAGERAFNLCKLLNAREGFSRADDAFPPVWLTPRMTPDGAQVLTDYYRAHPFTAEEIELLLDDYYDERGWDVASGLPGKEKLTTLGLEPGSYGS
ncbi:MAG: hypothetical protein HY900_37265, partial [Deltaproteobacteria bacterium]|nr:hypothetical protein [Deltaproteobacteria bacterium]